MAVTATGDAATNDRERAHLLLLADSGFPTGAFAHSWGLEWAVRSGWVTDGAGLYTWIRDALRFGAAPLEGQAVAQARELAGDLTQGGRRVTRAQRPVAGPASGAARGREAGAPDEQPVAREAAGQAERHVASRITRLSDEVASFLPSGEARAAGGQLGRSLLAAAGAALAVLQRDRRYAAVVQAARGSDHRLQHPVAWGFLGGALGIGAGPLVQAYLLSTARQWAQAAMRTIPIGQSEAYGVVGALLAEITELAQGIASRRRPPAGITPGWDLAMLGHGELTARYFRS